MGATTPIRGRGRPPRPEPPAPRTGPTVGLPPSPPENRPLADEDVPENLEARLHRVSQDGRLRMAFHLAKWAECTHHEHMAEARVLLDRFWEDHRATPPEEAAPVLRPRESRGDTDKPVVRVDTPFIPAERVNEPKEKTVLGLLIWFLIVGSWIPVGYLLASLPVSGLVRIGLFALIAYATLPLAVFTLRWLHVTPSERGQMRSPAWAGQLRSLFGNPKEP